eukprot:ctg_190.g154
MSEMVQNAKQADIRKYLGARRKGSAASSASCAAGEAPREAWPGRWVQCPVCAERMALAGVNGHLDVCLDQREVLGRWERSRAGVMGGGCRERLGAEMGDASAPARIWSGEAADECRVGPYAARALLFAVQWVLQYEAHLLHAEEADVLRQVLQLARPARWLLARLLRRQGVGDGRWIRFSDMVRRYADTDVPVAVRELVAAKLARAEPIDAADWTALLPTLTAPERRELCVQLQLRTDSMLETAVRQPMGSGQSAGWSPAQQRLATMALPAVRLAASAWQACQVAFRILQPLGLETVFQTGQCIASPLPNTPDAAIQWAGRPARPLFETRAALDAYQEAAEWERSFEEALTQPSGAPLALAVAERAGAALPARPDGAVSQRVYGSRRRRQHRLALGGAVGEADTVRRGCATTGAAAGCQSGVAPARSTIPPPVAAAMAAIATTATGVAGVSGGAGRRVCARRRERGGGAARATLGCVAQTGAAALAPRHPHPRASAVRARPRRASAGRQAISIHRIRRPPELVRRAAGAAELCRRWRVSRATHRGRALHRPVRDVPGGARSDAR